jgi:hypothetical protein
MFILFSVNMRDRKKKYTGVSVHLCHRNWFARRVWLLCNKYQNDMHQLIKNINDVSFFGRMGG